MEFNQLAFHISWVIVAVKEKIKFINQEMKPIFNNIYLKNDKLLIKSQYHLNLARTLLSQVEKNYLVYMKNGLTNNVLITRIKNTYLQRCVFQLSMSYDCYKENMYKVENVSLALAKSLLNKFYQAVVILNNLVKEVDSLISMLK